MAPNRAEERAKHIKLLLFDVDGVLTDGTIFLFPAPPGGQQHTYQAAHQHADAGGYAIVSQNVIEAKGFNAHDGTGISLARLGGIRTGVITKRISETVALRARDLKNLLIFTTFRPAMTFGHPTTGRVVISFAKINVRG